ncbi:hypothetical protein BY996DRAFT_6518809 [Phakopsora pachyrhizi]|uniref:Uncharacterized protein n=1 Tax=Phakopsora pachyrhizi TaxID=170000 RepID=A0AAV0BCE9_PHAPC|nr:hypothetical protein BY996DRAFT_6518809 [Phakopsora pachyrhizi]CAH7684820.1 hypothetical protein PPACK8108_LOCUS19247 [Phakopsora pachyrhizi]
MALNASQLSLVGPQAPSSLASDAGVGQTSPMPNLDGSTTPSLPPYSKPPTPFSMPNDLIEEIVQYVERGRSPNDYWYQAPLPVMTEAGDTESLLSSMDIEIVLGPMQLQDFPVLPHPSNFEDYPVYPNDF